MSHEKTLIHGLTFQRAISNDFFNIHVSLMMGENKITKPLLYLQE